MYAVQELLKSRIFGRASPKGWVSFNCPMCVVNGQSRPDSKHRGGLMYGADGSVSYHCFNCDYKASWQPGRTLSFKLKKLLKQLGYDEADIQRLNLQLLSQVDEQSWLNPTIPEEKWTPNWTNFNFDFDLTPIKDPEKIAYLQSRGLENLATWLETTETHAGLNRRVILPFTYNNLLVGFTARWALGHKPDEQVKYFKKCPSDYVYGLDHQNKQRQLVIVTESEFDSLITRGVAIGSNNISKRQVQLIEELDLEPIVVPDKDQPGLELVAQTAEYGWSASFPEWGEGIKDINEAAIKYGRMFVVNNILQNIETSQTKIKLMAKRYCR